MPVDERFAEIYTQTFMSRRRNEDGMRMLRVSEYAPLLNWHKSPLMAVYAEVAKSNSTTCFLCSSKIMRGTKRLVFDAKRIRRKVYYCPSCARNRLFNVLKFLDI